MRFRTLAHDDFLVPDTSPGEKREAEEQRTSPRQLGDPKVGLDAGAFDGRRDKRVNEIAPGST
jgi:hypothetical protein